MIIEHAIESVSDDNQTVIDALKLAISPRVYHPKNASTCKRMVLHIVAQFGGVPDPAGHITDAAQKESKCDRT